MSTAAGNPKPAATKSVDLFIWNALGRKSAILFGEECASVAVWTFIVLLIRAILYMTYVEDFVPLGLLFAFPLLVDYLAPFFPFLRSSYPILPFRVSECFLGKVSPARLLVIIPAHLLGAIFGALLLKTVIPFLPSKVLRPLDFPGLHWTGVLLVEVVVNYFYCMGLLVLPYIYDVNRVSTKLVSLTLLPVLVTNAALNPALAYALWFLNHSHTFAAMSSSLPSLRIVAPLLGAMLAGLTCSVFFPDDTKSWSRTKSRPLC